MWWPTFRNNQYNNPQSILLKETDNTTEEINKIFIGGIIWATAVIDNDNNIYVGSTNKRFYCINEDFKIKWIYKIDNEADALIDSAAALHPNGTVIIPGGDGCIHAVEMSTGRLIWKQKNFDISHKVHETGVQVNSFEGNIQIDKDGMIYAGCDNEYLYCLYPDGNIKWKFRTKMMIWTCPVIVGDLCIFGSLDFNIYVVNRNTGALKYKNNVGSEIKSSPLYHDGLLYIGTTNGVVLCLDGNFNIKWKIDIGFGIYSSPIIYESGIIYASFDGMVVNIDRKNGTIIWKIDLRTNLCCSPVIVNDVFYIGDGNGYLYAINSSNGSLLGSIKLCQRNRKNAINCSIAIDKKGNLVVGAYDGFLYKISINFYKHYHDAKKDLTSQIKVIEQNEHIITMELVIPDNKMAGISSVIYEPNNIPFEFIISADGRFINLIPTSWCYLSKKYTISIKCKYYTKTDSWLKDRLVMDYQWFQDTISFQTYACKGSTKVPKTMNLYNFYIHQPIVLDTYIPAAMDAQGFKVISLYENKNIFKLILMPAIPDDKDFINLDKDNIVLKAEKFLNVIRASGKFTFSAMGGTIQCNEIIAYLNINDNGSLNGQFWARTTPFNIKGNGSSYKFSSEMINKVCDKWLNIDIIGELNGTITNYY